MIMAKAWIKLTNRTTGKFCHVRCECYASGNYVPYRAYCRALEKLGYGRIGASHSFIAFANNSQRTPRAAMDADY